MDIKKFFSETTPIIDAMNNDDLLGLHLAFLEQGCYGTAPLDDIGTENSKLREAIKFGIQRISMDDLRTIAPASLRIIVDEFLKQEKNAPDIHYPEPKDDDTEQDREPEQDTEKENESTDETDTIQVEGKPKPTEEPSSSHVDRGVNLKPGEALLDSTSRTGLMSVVIRERMHMIPKEQRQNELYAFVGIDVKGEPFNMIRDDERDKMPLSMVDLAVFYLADTYRKYRKADHRIKLLRIEREKLLQQNTQLQQAKTFYEQKLIEMMIFKE